MKKVTLVMLIGLWSFTAMAQDSVKTSPKFTIGVHGGAGPASFIGLSRGLGVYQPKYIPRLGSMHGLFFQYQILPKMGLCFEVNYESKGMAYSYPYLMHSNHEHYGKPQREIYVQEFISLPALMKFKLNAKRKRTEWFVKSGMNMEFQIRSSVRSGMQQFNYPRSERPNVSVSCVAGFGVNIPVRKNGIISIEARDMFTPKNAYRYKNNNLLVLLVGFGIKL